MKASEVQTILALKGITKSFPGVKVLDGVNLDIRKGEVHALLGENGAGKSTLMKIISGLYTPDAGAILYRDEPIVLNDPLDAKRKGIILIHQEISLVPELSVAENIFLGSIPLKRFHRIDWKKLFAQSRQILDELHCDFAEDRLAGSLTIARQQMVEIARALAYQANLVIFDEPTSSLTDQEKDVLFHIIRKLKSKGVGIVYISHRMDEIFAISDRISVLRDGVKTGERVTAETSPKEVTRLMIGRDIDGSVTRAGTGRGDEVLSVERLSGKPYFRDISFSIRKGEVLGLYGLVGAGRSELAETIFGLRKADGGTIRVEGKEVRIPDSRAAVDLGFGLIPEDRKRQGLVLHMSCEQNLSLAGVHRMHKWGLIRRKLEASLFDKYRQLLAIKTSSPENPVVHLSGGNQQKIIIGKWLAMNPKLLILDEPTRGIDVGSKTEIHKLIRSMADEGYSILVISSEMPEIMSVSDRIITMCQGKMTAEFSREIVTENHLILGATDQAI